MPRAEYEDLELCTMIADWFNGGSKGKKMHVKADDVEILEPTGQRLLSTPEDGREDWSQ